MAVNYVLVGRLNPQKPKEPKKFYAQVKSSGEVTMQMLGKIVADRSTTVSDTDVLAVLNDLSHIMAERLAEGDIIRFGDFGSFELTISSTGADTEKEFTASRIHSPKVNFHPGANIKEMFSTLKYVKTEKAVPKSGSGSGGSDGGGDDLPGHLE
jgi:predicted histone-like DNA-binding protein